MHRFLISPHKVRGSTIAIDDPKAIHHIRDVLRLGVGDRVVCFDGTGTEYAGTIIRNSTTRLLIQVDKQVQKAQGPLTLWLAQGLPKADRFDWVVQKATELGVARIVPLITRHTVLRLTTEQGQKKLTRWQRVAQEAAQQCGRVSIPAIDPPQPFERFLASIEDIPLILMPTLAVTTIPLSEILPARPECGGAGGNVQPPVKAVAVLIGPEGDFSREEVALAEARGARPVSLGSLTLRSETAALATLAIVRYVFGESG